MRMERMLTAERVSMPQARADGNREFRCFFRLPGCHAFRGGLNSPMPLSFAAIGLNHGHIYGQVHCLQSAGAVLTHFHAEEDELAGPFQRAFPQARRVASVREILEDPHIRIVASASIPCERAPLGIEVMRHGKDFFVDKPGVISLDQLAAVRRVQAETKAHYSIFYGERFENRATVKALDLVRAGAIGTVVQTIGLGPHRLNAASRPDWFWKTEMNGGILTDIASHQVDQFLAFTGSTRAEVVSAHVGHLATPEHPGFQDYGEMTLRGDGGMGHIRVDWFTPDGLGTWGDGRLIVLGTEGYLEIRKNIDPAGRPGGNHLILVDRSEIRHWDCAQEPLPFGSQFLRDVEERTETAMSQAHCFLAMELALQAQEKATACRL
jgi:predicted dehydrogenase